MMNLLLDTTLKNLKTLVNNTVVKFNKYAKDGENLESLSEADAYIAASLKEDRFDLYTEFHAESIESAGLGHLGYDIYELAADPSLIPSAYQNAVLDEERKIIINNYVELNEYYRMLNGLPPLDVDESDFISLTEPQRVENGITSTGYIHQLSDIDLYKLQMSGVIDQLITEHPDAKYLNYLGLNKIDVIKARQANNFAILRISKGNVPDEFYSKFVKFYNQSREYFVSVIYNPDFGVSYNLYDNFMGMTIMIMTIQRMISHSFKSGIEREFYDWMFIQNLYNSYNIPFIKTLGIDHHVILMKNLNNLLRYKSTDKVLYDICSLLGYERLNIYKYYLVRQQKMDDNNNPLFYYKIAKDENGNDMTNDDGSYVYVEDPDKMYEIFFQPIEISEQNVTLALQNENTRLSYNEVTLNDPYWWGDDNLSKLLYGIGTENGGAEFNQAYNYVETKYMSMNLMYKMTEMLFEVTYAFNMILDKKTETDRLLLTIPKVADGAFSIFDLIIFLTCLLSKSNGFQSSIIMTPTTVANVYSNTDEEFRMYGFNFSPEQIEIIRSIIIDNSDLVDQETLEYFKNLSISTADQVDDMFTKIRAYNKFIINKMRNSKNIKEYHLYKDIFNISMTTEIQKNLYTITYIDQESGESVTRPATTYLEFLDHKQPGLANIVRDTPVENISEVIAHVISQIENFIPTLQYLFIINDTNNPVYSAITSLLQFFKSYTVDFTKFNIIYVFDSKYYNIIKMIEDIRAISSSMHADESLCNQYADQMKQMLANIRTKNDIIKFNDTYKNSIRLNINEDELHFRDWLKSIGLTYKYTLNMDLSDGIHNIITNNLYKGILNIKEKADIMIHQKYDSDHIHINDISTLNLILSLYDTYINDEIKLLSSSLNIKMNIETEEKIRSYLVLMKERELISMVDRIYDIHTEIKYSNELDSQYSSDVEHISGNMIHKNKLSIKDKLFLTYNIDS